MVPHLTVADLTPVLPAAVLALTGIVLMLSEAFLEGTQRTYQAMLALGGCVIAMGVAITSASSPDLLPYGLRLQGFAVFDRFSVFITATVAGSSALVVLLSKDYLRKRDAERGEFYALILFAAAGMSLVAVSAELVTLFINIEVLSIATYALTAFLRRGRRASEAGFKYFLLGAFASAMLLYGASLLYGATGSTHLDAIGRNLGQAVKDRPALVYAAFGLLLAGLAFKVSAIPFHMWTPDVYEGAPTPITGLMSAAVKAAAVVAMVRVLIFVGGGLEARIPYVMLSGLALATMVGGNLMALPQRNVKRMLAYSSIAHAGYLLLGVATLFAPRAHMRTGLFGASGAFGSISAESVYRGLLFYLLAYAVTAIGAFGVLGAIERSEDDKQSDAWDLDRLAGLSQRHPVWAAAMALFMLSLGGIPATAGFLGKVLIFGAAINADMVPLAVVGILSSAVAIYYYLKVVVAMYMRPSSLSEGGATEAMFATNTVLGIAALAVVFLGLMPGVVTNWLAQGALLFGG